MLRLIKIKYSHYSPIYRAHREELGKYYFPLCWSCVLFVNERNSLVMCCMSVLSIVSIISPSWSPKSEQKMQRFRKSHRQCQYFVRIGQLKTICVLDAKWLIVSHFYFFCLIFEQQPTIRNRRQVHLLCIVQCAHFVSILFIWNSLVWNVRIALHHPPRIVRWLFICSFVSSKNTSMWRTASRAVHCRVQLKGLKSHSMWRECNRAGRQPAVAYHVLNAYTQNELKRFEGTRENKINLGLSLKLVIPRT